MNFVAGSRQLLHQQPADELRAADDKNPLGLELLGVRSHALLLCAAVSDRNCPGHVVPTLLDAPTPRSVLIVVLEPEMRDQVFTLHPAKRVLQLH